MTFEQKIGVVENADVEASSTREKAPTGIVASKGCNGWPAIEALLLFCLTSWSWDVFTRYEVAWCSFIVSTTKGL